MTLQHSGDYLRWNDGSFRRHNKQLGRDIAIDNISVIDALNDDLAVTNVALANNDCDLTASEIITATVFNIGANSVTAFDIGYTVNGGTAVTKQLQVY